MESAPVGPVMPVIAVVASAHDTIMMQKSLVAAAEMLGDVNDVALAVWLTAVPSSVGALQATVG